MLKTVLKPLPLAVTMTLLLAHPIPAAKVRCEGTNAKQLAVLADAARQCMTACRDDAAGALRQCGAGAPDDGLGGCLDRAIRKAARRIRRVCRRVEPRLEEFVQTVLSEPDPGLAVCGDGRVSGPERCDGSASPNGGCPEGEVCTACLYCHTFCGDGHLVGDEVCEPEASPSGCAAGENCLDCLACGRTVASTSADEDVAPCATGVGDHWTFDVEAGTIVTMSVDTVDATSAAKLAFEGACPSRGFRRAVGFPCTFTPPNDPNPGYGCPRWSFVAPASGSCSLTVGVVPSLDIGNGVGCTDPAIARYRLSVAGTALVLVGDDVPPGLVRD